MGLKVFSFKEGGYTLKDSLHMFSICRLSKNPVGLTL